MTHSFYLAPLRGVTDSIFRTLSERYFGRFDYLLTPFITTVKGRGVSPSHIKDITGEENDRPRTIPQFIGNDGATMAVLTDAFYSCGYRSVNWNLGCPHHQIARKKRGSGLLPLPEMVDVLLDFYAKHCKPALSVKVRLGYATSGELLRLMPVLNRYPLYEVIIHPRTGIQGYAGTVDIERFAEAAACCSHPVVYNGDITSLQMFEVLKDRFPSVSRWMIGRGAVHYPGLLRSLRQGTEWIPVSAMLRAFHDELFAANAERLSGPAHLLGKMKEFWFYYCQSFAESKKVFKKITRCTTVDTYMHRVDEVFDHAV